MAKSFRCCFAVCVAVAAIAFLSLVGTSGAVFRKRVNYTNAQVWQLPPGHENVLPYLKKQYHARVLRSGLNSHVAVIRDGWVQKARKYLKRRGIAVSVVSRNLQQEIDKETVSERGASSSGEMKWDAYNRYSVMEAYLKSLAANFPTLVALQDIGKSAEGRSLYVLKIGNGNPKNKVIWIDAGIHAREWISSAAVMHIIKRLVTQWDSQPKNVKDITWHILAMLNPDGYEYSHTTDRLWRKNRRRVVTKCTGVDLNRNYGYKWGGLGASTDPCDETYRGPSAFSEPESQVMSNYMLKMSPPPSAYLTYHSYGQYLLYPWGYDKVLVENSADMAKAANAAAKAIRDFNSNVYTVGPSHLLGAAAGGSDDWARDALKSRYVYTVELRDKGKTGFILPRTQIVPAANEAFIFAKTIANFVTLT